MSDTEPEDTEDPKPQRKRFRKRKAAWRSIVVSTALLAAFVAAILFVSFFALMGRNVALPSVVVERVEHQLNGQMTEERIRLGSISIGLQDDSLRPTLDLLGLEILNGQGNQIAALPKLRTKLDTSELLLGRVALETLELDGATIRMTRDVDGVLRFAFGAEMGGLDAVSGSLGDVMTTFDAMFADPRLRELEEVNATDIRLEMIDARENRIIVIEDGTMSLINGDPVVEASVRFAYTQDDGSQATLSLALDKPKGFEGARVRAVFDDVSTRDLAGQLAALSWLDALDAPVSGALSLEIGEGAVVEGLAGTLEIHEGVLQPADQAKPVPFNSAKSYIRYEAGTQRLYLDGLILDAPELRLNGDGHADLLDFEAGLPKTVLAQVRLSDVRLDPEGIFETPVTFERGAFDMRYRPDALRLDIGQIVLENLDAQLVARGRVGVEPEGWSAALDATMGEIAPDHLLGLWPTGVKEKTRTWLTENVKAGKLLDAAAGLRLEPGEKLQTRVNFNFRDAEVRYLPTLPPISDATGFATITSDRFFLELEEGQVVLADDMILRADRSRMEISDFKQRPTVGRFDLRLDGTVETALTLLDRKPFEFLKKSDLSPDLAEGQAEIKTVLEVPFVKDLKLTDIGFSVDAKLRGVRSDVLIKDRRFEAAELTLTAGEGSLAIEGDGRLDGIPLTAQWSRDLGQGSGTTSEVKGQIELSDRALEAFNVQLPEGSVSGRGRGEFVMSLEKGAAPTIVLSSNLQGLGLTIDALGWRKPAEQAGKLDLRASLGEVPRVERLAIDAAGLSAVGEVTLRPGGGLERAVFDPLKVDDRLNSRIELAGRGKGAPVAIEVKGGQVDIRKFGVTGGRRRGGPLELALDRVVVTDNINLDAFRGKFRNDRGLDGTFTARLNGGAALSGVVVPTERGLAVRVQSDNGGGLLAASGIFRNAVGGQFDLTLQPNGRPGEFNGRLEIENTRVKKAPALADLLSAISVVGLLEQLSGDGILFGTVEANFLLTSRGVTLRSSSAVGPSMGITMDGVYDTVARRMDMQGVVSPIYVVNGLFGALFSPRKGEGLIGFNYGLRGSADNPQVQVNPLSALTPGIFREIFRRPPPKLSQ